MLNNVKDFGACGDGVSDDRVSIQTAIDEAVAHRKAGIWFPAGIYRVSRTTVAGGRWSLDLNGIQDFMVMGEGAKSVVKLVDVTPPGNWHVFILRNDCRRVVFKDLVIDGNRTALTNPDEQSHGIEVESGTEDLWIDGCILRECFGDGMRIVGAPGKHVKRLRIANSLFQANKRSGLAIQRALEQAIIANCSFDSTVTDQSIDIEPSGNDGPTDLVIQGCTINHTNQTPAVALSGISGPDPLVRCKFSDNIVVGGHIFCTDVRQLTIQNNTIVVNDLGTVQRIPIEVQRGGESVIITGNLMVNDDTATRAVISLSEVNNRQVTRALVADNLCFARSGIGIQCLSSDDIAIQSNMIVATGACNHGILVRSQSSAVDNISIRDNDITVQDPGKWEAGILIAADPEEIGQVSVTGNSIRRADKGIIFQHDGFTKTPVCALNRIGDDVKVALNGIKVLPAASIVVGGAASQSGTAAETGAARLLAGFGDPNDNGVIGNIGDLFQRLDGAPGETLYVKETGNKKI
jgi:hypothetical protein